MEESQLDVFEDLFSIGIQCMELNIADVDQAVRDFVAKTGQVSAPSWKYPTIKLHAVQVHQVIALLRNREISKERHYLDLLELLHDRLYYAFLVFLKYIRDLINLVNPNDAEVNKTGVPVLDNPLYIPVASPFTEENQYNSNIGLLVRQLRTKILELDGCIKAVLENLATTNSRALMHLGQAMVKLDRVRGIRMQKDKDAHSADGACQTETVHVQCCESCNASQNILRHVGDTLENCFKAFCNEDSMLTKTKCDLRDQIFWVSQWTSVSRWCDALRHDCNTIISKAKGTLTATVDLEQKLKDSQHSLNTQTRDHKLVVEHLENRCRELEREVQNERSLRHEQQMKKEIMESRGMELEKKLRTQCEMNAMEAGERIRLENAIASLEKINCELKMSQSATAEGITMMKASLENVRREKHQLASALENAQEELRCKMDEISQLAASTTVIEVLKKENNVLRSNNGNLKKKNESLTVALKEEKHQVKRSKNEVARLERCLEKSRNDLELLSSYPDLNGPIAVPELDPSDILGSMQKQLKANETRVELLNDQNRRLGATIEKLGAHLKQQADASGAPDHDVIIDVGASGDPKAGAT